MNAGRGVVDNIPKQTVHIFPSQGSGVAHVNTLLSGLPSGTPGEISDAFRLKQYAVTTNAAIRFI